MLVEWPSRPASVVSVWCDVTNVHTHTDLALTSAESRQTLALLLTVGRVVLPVHARAAVAAVHARIWIALAHHVPVIPLCQLHHQPPLTLLPSISTGATTFSKFEVQFPGLCYEDIQNKIRMVYPVSCTAVCHVTVIALFMKKVGAIRPNFGGPDAPPPISQWLRPWQSQFSSDIDINITNVNITPTISIRMRAT